MNTTKLKEFREAVYNNADLFLTKKTQDRANEIAKGLDNADLVPIYLLRKKRELTSWVMMNMGVQVDSNMGGCTIPCTCLGDNGEQIPTAIVLVVEETIDDITKDEDEKNILLRSTFLHELVHVSQIFKMGIEKFTSAAFDASNSSDRSGYINNILEKEAHAAQNKFLKENGLKYEFGMESNYFNEIE